MKKVFLFSVFILLLSISTVSTVLAISPEVPPMPPVPDMPLPRADTNAFYVSQKEGRNFIGVMTPNTQAATFNFQVHFFLPYHSGSEGNFSVAFSTCLYSEWIEKWPGAEVEIVGKTESNQKPNGVYHRYQVQINTSQGLPECCFVEFSLLEKFYGWVWVYFDKLKSDGKEVEGSSWGDDSLMLFFSRPFEATFNTEIMNSPKDPVFNCLIRPAGEYITLSLLGGVVGRPTDGFCSLGVREYGLVRGSLVLSPKELHDFLHKGIDSTFLTVRISPQKMTELGYEAVIVFWDAKDSKGNVPAMRGGIAPAIKFVCSVIPSTPLPTPQPIPLPLPVQKAKKVSSLRIECPNWDGVQEKVIKVGDSLELTAKDGQVPYKWEYSEAFGDFGVYVWKERPGYAWGRNYPYFHLDLKEDGWKTLPPPVCVNITVTDRGGKGESCVVKIQLLEKENKNGEEVNVVRLAPAQTIFSPKNKGLVAWGDIKNSP